MSSSGRKGVTEEGVKTDFLKDAGWVTPEIPFAANVNEKNGNVTGNATRNWGILHNNKDKINLWLITYQR